MKTIFKLGRALVAIFLFSGIFWSFNSNLSRNLNFPAIEIANDCKQEESRITCTRKFDPEIYSNGIKQQIDKFPGNEGVFEKIAGASPELFKYSISFTDNSKVTGWKDQNTYPIQDGPKFCNFSDEFKITGVLGKLKKEVGLEGIVPRLKEIATNLNDCIVPISLNNGNYSKIERSERYDVHVSLNWVSYVSITIFALIATFIILNATNSILKLVWKGWER